MLIAQSCDPLLPPGQIREGQYGDWLKAENSRSRIKPLREHDSDSTSTTYRAPHVHAVARQWASSPPPMTQSSPVAMPLDQPLQISSPYGVPASTLNLQPSSSAVNKVSCSSPSPAEIPPVSTPTLVIHPPLNVLPSASNPESTAVQLNSTNLANVQLITKQLVNVLISASKIRGIY